MHLRNRISLVALTATLIAAFSPSNVDCLLGAPILLENPESQYHIQVDQGPERFFRFQTHSGQYRKETRLEDGSVVGSYGWVDPNGVLRLYDYISDAGGYRIEQERLYKVGKRVDGYTVASRAGDLNLGFEIFPLDLASDPAFNGQAAAARAVPLGGAAGLKALHVPEGHFGLTAPFQAASLTSTYNDPNNPLSKQAQATFFEADPILVKVLPEPPPPKPRIVIGSARTSPPKPEPKPKPQIVIGYSNNNSEIRRDRNNIGRSSRPAAPRPAPVSRRPSSSTGGSRRSGIVIGRTAKGIAFEHL